MSITRKTLLPILLAGALAIPGGHAIAVPLLDLFDRGATITVFDKLFHNFTSLNESTVGEARLNLDNMDVTALTDDPMNPGIRFTGSVMADGEPDSAAFATLIFSFDVSTLSGDPLIIGNSLFLTDFTLNADPEFRGFINIGEQIFALGDPVAPIGSKEVFARAGGAQDLSDSAAFPSQSTVSVVKVIGLGAPGPNDLAVLREFEQRFAQGASVPEPGSLALLAVALAGLGFSRRKRIAAH